jgi:hypothetical protein
LSTARRAAVDRPIAALIWLLASAVGAAHAGDADTIARIPVAHRFASELEGPARAALSREGTLVVDPASNSFIIRDTPEAIAAVRGLLEALDTQPRQVTVTVRTVSREELERARAELHAGVRGDGIAIGNPPPPPGTSLAIGVVLSGFEKKAGGTNRQSVTVQSGAEARLDVGGSQPLSTSGAGRQRDVTLVGFGQTLRVRPTVLGDGNVRLEIEPSASTPREPRTGVSRSAGTATVVVVHPGDDVVLGGVEQTGTQHQRSWPASESAGAGRASLVYLLGVTLPDDARKE